MQLTNANTALGCPWSGGQRRHRPDAKDGAQAAHWTATANAPHQRRAHPWEAAPRSMAGARADARSAMRRRTRRWGSSFQRPPISAECISDAGPGG